MVSLHETVSVDRSDILLAVPLALADHSPRCRLAPLEREVVEHVLYSGEYLTRLAKLSLYRTTDTQSTHGTASVNVGTRGEPDPGVHHGRSNGGPPHGLSANGTTC